MCTKTGGWGLESREKRVGGGGWGVGICSKGLFVRWVGSRITG